MTPTPSDDSYGDSYGDRLDARLRDADVFAIAEDDRLLELLSTRRRLECDDPAAALLLALRDEVDEDVALDDLASTLQGDARLEADEDAPVAPVAPVAPLPDGPEPRAARRQRRRHVSRTLAAAAVAGGLFSVSGVAGAVTGDALAPYHAIARTVTVAVEAAGVELPERESTLSARPRVTGTRARSCAPPSRRREAHWRRGTSSRPAVPSRGRRRRCRSSLTSRMST